MQPRRPYQGTQYDEDMFTFLPTSKRDAYDEKSPMLAPSRRYGFPGTSGSKSYAGDFRDKELQNSVPASPRRASSRDRDYPRKSQPWDRKTHAESDYSNKDHHETRSEYTGYSPYKRGHHETRSEYTGYSSYKRDRHETRSDYTGNSPSKRDRHETRSDYSKKDRHETRSEGTGYSSFRGQGKKNYSESCHSSKRDRHETRSEYTGYTSFRGQLQSPDRKDFSPLPVGQSHTTSKWPASMTKDLNQFEHHEVSELKAKDKNASQFQKFWNCGPQKLDQMEVLATSSLDQSAKNIGKLQTLDQALKTGAFVVDIDGRDFQTYKGSKWSPLMTEAVNHLGGHESNVKVARQEIASDFQEFLSSGPQKPEQMNVMSSSSYDVAFKNLRESQSLQQSFLKPQAFSVGFDDKGYQTYKASKWPTLMAEQSNQLESHEPNREQPASHFQEFQNCGPENLSQLKSVAPSSHEQKLENTGGSQSFKQNFLNAGALVVDFDAKCCNEGTRKVESSSNVTGTGQTSSFTGSDNTKLFGENVGSSECNLQNETNRLLQNALRLLSAASGIVSTDNSSGKIQGQDDVKLMKLLLDSGIQNLKHSLVETSTSKNTEASPNPDECGLNGEKDCVESDDKCKYESKASAFTEKLWDGILQLSSSVSVSAVAFFKSGEKMQEFSWSDSVAVKGKVRLEAFEKYVQDLPRSRTRGLMVMSFCCKEGSSGAGLKDMKEVAQKYKERKKVGFAQLSNGVDLYLCPHSDAVITILAKHGFFKGMAAVRDKSDPLIGCVVWRKNPSSVAASRTTEANAPQPSEPSLRSLSDTSAQQVQSDSSTMANKNQEPISLSSVGGKKSNVDKLPESDTENMEIDKSNLQRPSVLPEHSEASDDDDDLPEYDFGAVVPQTMGKRTSDVGAVDSGFAAEKLRDDDVPRPISTQMRSESSIFSRVLPDFRIQGPVSQSMGHQSQTHSLSLPIETHKQIRECTASSKPPDNHFQGPVPLNRGHMHELRNPNLPVLQQQKQTEKSTANSKPSTLFDEDDDDDIPEWCPPGFTKPGPELTQGLGPSCSSSESKVPISGFASSALGHLPPLPPTPPPVHLLLQNREYPPAPCPLTSLANKPSTDGLMHKGPGFPPDCARISGFRPPFDPKGT